MNYQAGTHLIATLHTGNNTQIQQHHEFKEFLDRLISRHQLQKLGEVYHDFTPAGFTGVACLSESHISIHTWPEYNRINVDIYLSNYQRENDGTVQDIYEELVGFFSAEVVAVNKIRR